MKKRVLAALLALVMLFGALPMSVFAENVDADLNDTEDNEAVGYGTGDRDDDPVNSDEPNGQPPTSGTVVFTCPTCNMTRTETVDNLWTVTIDPTDATKATAKFRAGAAFTLSDYVDENISGHEFDQCHGGDDITWSWSASDSAWKANGNATITTKLRHSGGSTAPTGKPAALSETHYFTLNCNTPGCTAHSETPLSTIFGNMYRRVDTGDDSVYTIEFVPDKVNEELSYSNHQLRETTTGYQIDPMRITWKWENGEWKGTSTACDSTGWPFYVYAYVESTASSGTDEPGNVKPDLDSMGVLVWCIDSADGHATKKITYKLNALSYTGGAEKVGNKWKYSVTIDWDSIFDNFNQTIGTNHKKSGAYPSNGTITWTWTNGTWVLDEPYNIDGTTYLAYARVMYDESAAVPDHPDDLEQYKLYFKIACDDTTHDHRNLKDNVLSYLTIAYATNSTYDLWRASKTEDTYTVTINKAGLDAYMDDEESNGTMFTGHDVDTIAPTTLEWKLKNNAWVYQGEKTEYKGGKAIVVNVNAKAEVVEAPVPTEELLSKGSFSIASVYCGYDVNDTTHAPYEMRCDAANYIEGSFVENSAVKNANGTYTVKIRTAPYVDYFNQVYKNYKCPHAAKTETVSVTLAYTPDGELSEWQVVTVNGEKQRADIPVYCEKAPDAPSVTLTYDGNAPEAGKTVTNLPAPQKEHLQAGTSVVTFQLSKDVPACEGYKFLGWTTDRNSNNPTFPVENMETDNWKSTTGNPNYILYAVWQKAAPTEAEVKSAIGALGNLRVLCLNPKTDKNNCNFCDWPYYAAGSASEPVKVNDTTYTVTVDAEKFAKVYKGNRGPNGETVAHNLYSPATLSWTLTYANGEWKAVADQPNYIFVTHAPMKWEEVGKIATGTGVDTTCVTTGKYANYGLTIPFVYYGPNTKPYHDQVISVDYDETTKSYAATFKVDTFADSIAKVCVNSQLAHKLTTKEELTWIFSVKSVEGTTASWKAEPKTADDAKVTVQCLTDVNVYINPVDTEGEPLNKLGLTPLSDETLDRIGLNNYDDGMDALLAGSFQSNAALQAEPDVDDVAEELLENGTFQIASANNKANFEKNNILEKTDWTYVEPDENYMLGVLTLYSVKFETEDEEHVTGVPADDYYLLTEEFKLPNPTRPGFKFLGWKANADTPVIYSDPTTDVGSLLQAGANYRVLNNVTFTAVWEAEMHPVQLVIYRNGDTTTAYKTVPLDKMQKGQTLDLSTIDVNAYYDGKNTGGKIDFYGWYNDGKWNNYLKDPANPPAGLEKITINGWTNLKCMVYDHEKVVVKALYDGSTDVKNAEVLYTGTARKGANTNEVLNGLGLTLDKTGYTHTEWFKDGLQYTFGENDTINGWTNAYVKYTRKSYNVVAKLYLNGQPVMKADGTSHYLSDAVTGLYGDTIDYSAIETWAKGLVVNDIDKDNTPDAAATTVKIYKDGGKYEPNDTFGNPDVSPNYVWADVTTYYKVAFNSDGGSEVAAQRVKYGETLAAFDEPTKDGYKFLGWFTEADEAFDLTTPITKSMTLTATWARNTYTIIYHGNGGVKVKDGKTHEQVTSAKLPIGEPTTLKSAEFTRDNYRFLGWSYFENGSVYFKAAEKNVLFEESDIDENGNVHLYAIWKRLSYPVTLRYNANTTDEVTNMPEPLEQTKDSDETGNAEFNISGMIPGRAGYRFLGWAVNKPDAAEDDIDFKAGESSIFVVNYQDDITLYAVWQELYTVTYSYDPSLPAEVQATIPKDPDTYTVGQKVTTAAKPNSVRVGENIWTFKTWKLDGVEVAPNTQVEMVSGGLHFEGIWETKLIHYSLTIQYVDKKGKELAESHMDLLSKGEAYKVDSPKIKGYKLKDKDDAVIKGTMPGRNLTIEVVYIKKSTGGGSGTIDSPNKPTTKAPALTLNTDDHFAFINGYPDGSVQPEGNVTRAETAAILYRIMGDACQSYYKTNSSSYSDVARGDWYNTYVATLENAGVIVDTRTNGKFRPNDAITRAELASMIAQFAGLESASAAKFNDVGSRYWAAEEIAIAAKMGWINGYPDGSFRPDRNVTRAELMAMVNRALGRTPKSADDLLSGMKTWRDNANVNAWYYLDVQEATNDHTYTKSGTHETWKKLL